MDLNPNDLIHAAPEVRNIIAIIVGGVPVAEIVKSILLPSAAVLGKRVADRVDRLFEKTGKMVQDAGMAPQPVSDKLIVEIVRGSSLEDNEDLHTMWAALLANAASPDGSSKVRPGFIAALRQMAPDEAALLNSIAEITAGFNAMLATLKAPTKALLDQAITAHHALHMVRVREMFTKDGEDETTTETRWQACVQVLQAAGLIEIHEGHLNVSALGQTFLEACRPPKPTT